MNLCNEPAVFVFRRLTNIHVNFLKNIGPDIKSQSSLSDTYFSKPEMIAVSFKKALPFSSCFSFKAEEEEEKTPLPFSLLGCDQTAVTDTVGVPDKRLHVSV